MKGAAAKRKLVELFGGECNHCCRAYPPEVFDFHHRNPATKKFSVGHGKGDRRWASVKAEARKCLMLCANCHRLEHARWRMK